MREAHPRIRQSVRVARGPAWPLGGVPFRVEKSLVAQPDEQRIEGPGLQPEFFGEVVPVPPLARARQQGRE